MKHLRNLISCLLVMAFLVVSIPAMAGSLTPLNVQTPVGDVAERGCVQLPIITWGGEYAMTHGNGDALQTQSGSVFQKLGLCFKLKLQDDPKAQIADYRSGKSPFMRGTLDMITAALPSLNDDPRLKPVVFALLTRSTGGDATVVDKKIKTAGDWKGMKVALQRFGPHMYYFWTILQTAGLSVSDVNIVWMDNLTGAKSPAEIFETDKSVAVSFMIIPDALAATSNGDGCNGGECSRIGAKILLSTKSASNVIFDVYAVRSDYYEAHKSEVHEMVKGLIQSQEQVNAIFKAKKSDNATYSKMVKAFAKIVLGSENAIADAEGMFADCTPALLSGNKKFFAEPTNPRGFAVVSAEIQKAFKELGALTRNYPLDYAKWDYAVMQAGGQLSVKAEAPVFNQARIAAVVAEKQKLGTLDDSQIFPAFTINFAPNQSTFQASQYLEEFDRVITDISTYGGAVLVVTCHSDPLGYLKAKKAGQPLAALKKIRQSAKNLSLTRGYEVVKAIIAHAKSKGVTLDPSQFTVDPRGFESPLSGMCGNDPCAPKNKEAWLKNMRVEFLMIQVEAEAVEFEQL